MTDSVNEYGLGAPDSQTDPAADTGLDRGPGLDREPGLEHGLGPTDGPFEGESAPEEEGSRFGLGADNTQDAPPVAEEATGDPMVHGLGPSDEP